MGATGADDDVTPASEAAGLATKRLLSRSCPLCGAHDASRVLTPRLAAGDLDEFSFASRKQPEFLHYRLVECARCALLYADPAPPAELLAAAYRLAAYDSSDESHDAARTYVRVLTDLATLTSTVGALDIGTGDGALLEELLAAGFTDVLGVEPSAAPVSQASGKIRARIREGVFRAEDFAAGQFSLITALQVLEHVPDPLTLCSSARTLLRGDGALFVVAHDRRALANRVLGRRSPIYDLEHLQLFDRRALRELLERAGYSDVTVRSISNRYSLHYWVRLLPMPRAAKRFLDRRLPRTRIGRLKVSLRVGNLAAIGYRRA